MEVRSKKPVLLSLVILSMIVMYRRYHILTAIDRSYLEWSEAGGVEDLWSNSTKESPIAPCSFRRMERNQTELWQKFNFSMPVFQWNQSYSQEEYKRLSARHLPYGWNEIPEDVVKSTLAFFNTPMSTRLVEPQYREQCLRCAVVGNGGILRDSGQGRDIDSHDLVFRTNAALTQGFEVDVGNRTSFYGFSTKTAKMSLDSYKEAGFVRVPQGQETRYLVFPTTVRDFVMIGAAMRDHPVIEGEDIGDSPRMYFGRTIKHDHFKLVHPDFIYYLTMSFLNSSRFYEKREHIYRPTSGALLLLTALHICDQVSAYGFITNNYGEYSEHYYDSMKKRLKFITSHDLKMESLLWKSLHDQSILRLYTRADKPHLPKPKKKKKAKRKQ